MADAKYAHIKGEEVVNISMFNAPSNEEIAHFTSYYDLDAILPATEWTEVGGSYDGTQFWKKKPYPSFTKNRTTNEWEAPTPYPTNGKEYAWDESSRSWKELPTAVPQDTE